MDRNTLNLKLSYAYIYNLIQLSWNDIKFFIEQKYLSDEGAILHSYKVIENSEDLPDDDVISLSLLIKRQTIYPLIDRLSKKDTLKDKSLVKEKALFIILSWLYENKNKYDDPLQMVEVIYADFDYSTKIEKFIKYMPSKDRNKSGIEQLYFNWKEYLKNEKEYLEKKIKEN